MATIVKDLGAVTAYAYAKEKGYTGTEDEFAELMASYADVAEQAADSAAQAVASATAAEQAKANAASSASAAASSASTASTKASEAASSASSAAGSANTATTKANEASTSATNAASSASAAATSATNAGASATAAASSSTAASNAQAAAETAQGKAEDAQTAAEDAAASVSESAAQITQNAEDIADLKSAVDDLEADQYKAFATETASGLIASFQDGADNVPVKGMTIAVEPVQAGSGEPAPDNVRPISGWTGANVTRTGVNVWDEETESGAISASMGTPSANSSFTRSKNFCPIKPGLTYFRGAGTVADCALFFYRKDKSYIGVKYLGTAQPFDAPADAYFFKLHFGGTAYGNNISVNYPATDTSYHAYSGATYSITFPSEAGEIGGGTLDVTTGKLTVDRMIVDLGTLPCSRISTNVSGSYRFIFNGVTGLKWSASLSSKANLLCSQYPAETVNGTYLGRTGIAASADADNVYVFDSTRATLSAEEFSAAMSGTKLCYELATPIVYDLTPAEVTTILAKNNIWADCGNSTVNYRADTALYVDKATFYELIDETEADLALLNSHVEELSNISDAVRSRNVVPSALFESYTIVDANNPTTRLAVTAKYYSGVHLSGVLSPSISKAFTKDTLSFEAGKTYTLYIKTNSTKSFGFIIPGLQFEDATGTLIYKKNEPVVILSQNTVTTHLNIWQNGEADLTFDDDVSLYLVEGDFSAKYFDRYSAVDLNVENYKETSVTQALTVGLPILKLTGSTIGMSKDTSVNLSWEYGDDSGNCTLKWQGASSVSYQKKNYTIKLNHAIDVGFGAQKKYCLKANYIDATHALNICTARLWSQIVRDRGTNPAIESAPNCGAVDGFPVIVELNGEFHGLYTWNIPKDKWMFGMGDSTTEYIVTAEQQTTATRFESTALMDGSDFELEYAEDSVSADTVKTALNTMLSAVVNSSGANWQDSVSPYLDIDSAIDYMILAALVAGQDIIAKNFILTTWNGQKWYMNAYDLDSTFGNHWTGGQYYGAEVWGTKFAGQAYGCKLFRNILENNKAELAARYRYLRSDIMSENNIMKVFTNFAVVIPEAIRAADRKKYPQIPATMTDTIDRIMLYYRLRCEEIDAEVNAWQL